MRRLDCAQNINQRKITHVIRSLLFFAALLLLPACDSAHNKIQASRAGSEVTTITKITPIAAKPDEVVRLAGTNFYEEKNLNVSLMLLNGDVVEVPVSVSDSRNASFVMPAGAGLGVKDMTLTKGSARIEITKFNLIADQGNNQLPIVVGDGSTVCSDQRYIDRNGDTRTGTKDCSVTTPIAACSENGAVGCVTNETFKSADLTNLSPSNIKSGVNIAGVIGNITPSPDACSSNGQQSCVATGTYFAGTACAADGSNCFLPTYSIPGMQTKKAIDVSTIDSSKMLDSLTVSGVTGAITSKGSWNLTAPFPGSGYYTGVTNTPATSTYTGTLFGVGGSAILKPNDCSTDGGIGCVTTANFTAAATTGAAAKIIQGQTVGGVSGAVHLPSSGDVRLNVTFGLNNTVTGSLDPGAGVPAICTSESQTNCVANSNFPAVDFAKIAANPDKMLSDFSVVGVSGSISTCAADGSNCFIPTYSVMSQPLKAINYNSIDAAKMLSSLTISDVVGSLVSRGSWDLTTAFPGAGYYTGTSNQPSGSTIATGTNIVGVSGSATLKPADCAADGGTGCVTTADFPAAQKTGAASKILSGQSVAGVSGNVTLPAVGKVLTGTQYGVSGTGSNGTLTLPSAANVLSGTGTYGESGDQMTPALADRGTWNLTNAFPGAGYYAGVSNSPTAPTIATGTTITGVAGSAALRPADCSADGGVGCVVVGPSFAAAATTGAASKILSGQSVAGVSGNVTLPAVGKVLTGTQYGVSGTGSTGTLTLPLATNVLAGSGTYGESGALVTPSLADRGTWNLTNAFPGAGYYAGVSNSPAATTIASGTTITGVAGSATLAPANCSSNGQRDCVATGTYFAGTECSANGSACYLPSYVASTQPLRAINFDTINSSQSSIRSSVTLGGVTGTLADCTTNGSSTCVATSSYPAGQLRGSWDMTTSFPGAGYYSGSTNAPTAGSIKSGVAIAGVTGQYPNSTFKLTGSSGTDLTSATFNAQIKSSATFQYFGGDGTRYTGSGDSDIQDLNIKSSIDIFGTTGTVMQAVAPDPWNVRVGTTINGVTGKLKVNCRNRSNPSIADVSEGNTVTVTAGTPGTLTASTTLSSIKISNGVAVRVAFTSAPGGLSNSTTYYVRDAGFMAFKLATTVGGTAIAITSIGTDVMVYRWQESPQSIDIWDTIDDLNNDISGLPPSVVTDWGNSTDCGGVQTAAGDDNVWQDVTTTNGVTASTCAATSSNCTMKDKITGLWWSKLQVAESWHMAWRRCAGIFNVSVYGSNSSVGYNGKTGWRLPTQKELLEAYTHGIRSAARTNWILESNMTKDNDNDLWSGSVNSLNGGSAWRVALGNGEVASRAFDNAHPFFCVR